jgi:trehalose-6-phosphate synthase
MGASRLLDLKHSFKRGGILGIEYYGRFVTLRVQHIGIDINDIKSRMNEEKSRAIMREFKEKLFEKTKQRNLIFSSVDRNHIISGIKNKFIAYLQCLDNYPRLRNAVCLV